MNTKLVETAADLMHRAMLRGTETAAGLAIVLESAQLLQSPETAAETELLRARVAELEAERHSTNEALSDAAEALREQRDRIAELEAAQSRDALTRTYAPVAALREDVSPQVQKLRNLLAGQREAQGEHYAAVHHTYRISRDLPEMGGAS